MDGAEGRRPRVTPFGIACALVLLAWLAGARSQLTVARAQEEAADPHDRPFLTSQECLACHNGLTSASGEDVSIGAAWRGSMMANSSRDPYWQAAVRREIADHPTAGKHIEDECSICHMPMSTSLARSAGSSGAIFAHLPVAASAGEMDRLAADGVSCTLCHQIGPGRLGTRESFTGGFELNRPAQGSRAMFGPFEVDEGRRGVMRSATGVTPEIGSHVSQSELCATCHTLFTDALDGSGRVIGRLPEQVPYLEWRHSAFRDARSCQSCHMPAVAELAPAASILGQPRPIARHTFVGGNFLMLRMLNRHRTELGVEASSGELEASVQRTLRQLESTTATVAVGGVERGASTVAFDVVVRNLTGHKFPTGYPSRRAWLHVTVRNGETMLFESGRIRPDGSIEGNDNDLDARAFEPHHDEIRDGRDVQIYEAVMTDAEGGVTTGLLSAVRFAKDNRLLPEGFEKGTADQDIAVQGSAASDENFDARGDRVRYVVNTAGASGPLTIEVVLRFQPIAFRWADNLRTYDLPETRRFVSYYDAMAASSSAVIATDRAIVN